MIRRCVGRGAVPEILLFTVDATQIHPDVIDAGPVDCKHHQQQAEEAKHQERGGTLLAIRAGDVHGSEVFPGTAVKVNNGRTPAYFREGLISSSQRHASTPD